MAAPVCEAHPDTPAVSACKVCFRPVCAACMVHDGLELQCPQCARAKRRSRRIWTVVGVVAAVAAVGGGVWISRRGLPPALKPQSAKVSKLEAELKKEPCDRRKIVELVDALLDEGDGRAALERSDAFLGSCGDYPRLRGFKYRAHLQLSEFDQAIAETTKLVDDEPFDASYRAWRGRAYRQKGDLPHAIDDFEQALVLNPRLADVPLDLAAVYEKQGKPCEAASPLEQLVHHYPGEKWTGGIRTRIADLEAKGNCVEAHAAAGHVKLKVDNGAIRAEVKINDRGKASFVVDTGASHVTIARSLAEKSGVEMGSGRTIVLSTANGQRKGILVSLARLEVQGLVAKSVPAVVLDEIGETEGLLGLSFLTRFEMRQRGNEVELSARETPAAGR